MVKETPFVGIDFGTYNSCMAWFNPATRRAEVLNNADDEPKTRSVVYFGDGELLVGKLAEEKLEHEKTRGRVVDSAKRNIGRAMVWGVGDGRQVTPVDVATEVLGKLRRDANALHFHAEVRRAVITVPAIFDGLERERIKEAGRRAGFEEVALMDEPVAAALAYFHDGFETGRHVLVYDLGAGTFDLALLARDDDESTFYPIIVPRGLRKGGDDLDRALYDDFDWRVRKVGGPLSDNNTIDLHILRLCRKCKENLSTSQETTFSTLLPDGMSFEYKITRREFEGIIEATVAETVSLTGKILHEADKKGYVIDEVVLIGGSSRIPLVSRMLGEKLSSQFGARRETSTAQLQKWRHQDIAVALGAAYHAETLWGLKKASNTGQGETKPGQSAGIDGEGEKQKDEPDEKRGAPPGVTERKVASGLFKPLVSQYVKIEVPGTWNRRPASDLNAKWETLKTPAKVEIRHGEVYHLAVDTSAKDRHISMLTKLDALPGFQGLSLSGCSRITDAGLDHLRGLAALQELNLSGCTRVTDVGLTHLRGHLELRSLDLSHCDRVTDAGIAHLLNSLIGLRSLNLSYCSRVTDAGLTHLCMLAGLQGLDLSHCERVTDAGLAHLRGLAGLRSLDLVLCNWLTDAGLFHLRESAGMQNLKLSQCSRVTDAGLAHLRGLTGLEWLDLSGCSRGN
jgi:actin-like ATPase involved in cell morphogenesis